VFVLGYPVYGPVEVPIEDDAGRFAAETRIVFAFERGSGLLSGIGQLAAAIEARACAGASARPASAAGVCGSLAGLVFTQFGQLHHAAAGAAWIHHDVLHRRPLARDVWFTRWPLRRPVGGGPGGQRAADFLQAALRRLDVLAVA